MAHRGLTIFKIAAIVGGLGGSACGPKNANDDTSTAQTSDTPSDTATSSSPPTGTEPTTSHESTSMIESTGAGGSTTSEPGGICPPGWELPATIVASVTLFSAPDDPSFPGEFDPAASYPDGTPAACVRWDGDQLAGVRLAFGPAVGDQPQHLLEVVASDGERSYSVDGFPPPPGAYDGMNAVYTVIGMNGTKVRDYAMNQGTGFLDVVWVPRQSGEHIVANAKLSMGMGGADPLIGFDVDAVIAPAVDVTPEFCAGLDTPTKCMFGGCAEWVRTEVVDPATCERMEAGQCVFAIAMVDSEDYDSAFFATIDGALEIKRVGGEACDFVGPQFPQGWTECTGGPGEPAACTCVCAGGVCPGDAALALLEGCMLPQPCGDLDDWAAGEDCFYQALQTNTPAVLRAHIGLGDPDLNDRVYLHGDGTAMWLHGHCDVSCFGSCADRDWGVPRTCTLREPAFFSDCAANNDPEALAKCRDVANWFTDCAVAAAGCP